MTTTGNGKRLMAHIHHTDADRDQAYDRESSVRRLNKGLGETNAKGWTIVDMEND